MSRLEFGDYQTPAQLATRVAKLIGSLRPVPKSILEPTCGVGNLLFAALEAHSFEVARGLELNPSYAQTAQERLPHAEITQGDFFVQKLDNLFSSLPEPRLMLANPPWVTSASIGASGGTNLPNKQNLEQLGGMAARTGKSNFDLSEAMLLPLLEQIEGTQDTLMAIIKTIVARKLLKYAALHDWKIHQSAIYQINAKLDFGAAVDACVFVCQGSRFQTSYDCAVYASLESPMPSQTITVQNNTLIADCAAYQDGRAFLGKSHLEWRSGIKHDCSSLMELKITALQLENGLGQMVNLEPDCLYPMLKSSDLGNARTQPRAMMLVSQTFIGEPTTYLPPKTLAYLQQHRTKLAARGSSIYLKQPEFAIFGVGAYSFSPWKVAISGLYKHLEFNVVAPHHSKPMVFDDTCYFLPCQNEAEARLYYALLTTPEAQNALHALIFWDEKRPITKGRLNQLELAKIALHTRQNILLALQKTYPALAVQIQKHWFALEQHATADVPLFA